MTDKEDPPAEKPKAKRATPKKPAAKNAAPKKPTAAQAKKEAEAAAKERDARRKELQAKLEGYCDELADQRRGIAEKTGELRARIKAILLEEDWHKGAFGDIRKIEGMSETARADFLRSFKPLFDAMYYGVWSGEMEDMLKDMDDDAKAKLDPLATPDNVVKMPGAKSGAPTKKAHEADLSDLDKELGRK